MDTRASGRGTTSDQGRPDIEVRRDDAAPVVIMSPEPPRPRSRRTWILAVVLVLGLLLAVAVVAMLGRGGDEKVAATPAAGAAEPAALTVSIDPPGTVVAGTPAALVVRYADGLGTYSGSTEDWGDGVGAGSVSQGRCDQTTAASANGSYRATHTWAEPGTYTVAIEVTTYSCQGGRAVEEQASASVDVLVTAR